MNESSCKLSSKQRTPVTFLLSFTIKRSYYLCHKRACVAFYAHFSLILSKFDNLPSNFIIINAIIIISNKRKGCQIKHMLSIEPQLKKVLTKKVYYDCTSLKIENKIEPKLNSNYLMLKHVIFFCLNQVCIECN